MDNERRREGGREGNEREATRGREKLQERNIK